jgi:hypothetical protein
VHLAFDGMMHSVREREWRDEVAARIESQRARIRTRGLECEPARQYAAARKWRHIERVGVIVLCAAALQVQRIAQCGCSVEQRPQNFDELRRQEQVAERG